MTPQGAAALRLPLTCATLIVSALVFSGAFTSFLHPKEIILATGLLGMAVLGAVAAVKPCDGFRYFLPLWAGWLWLVLWHGIVHPPVLWGAALVELARIAVLLLFVTMAFDLCQSPRTARWILRAMVVSAACCAVLALLQYFDLALRLFPRFSHYDQKMYSVFGNQDLLGSYLALALALVPLGRIRSRCDAVLRIVVAAPIVAALALSGSRSAWLAAAIGLAIALLRMKPRRHALAAAAVLLIFALICVALAPTRTLDRVRSTFAAGDIGARVRLWTWDGALRMVRAYPLSGVGPANFQFHSPRFMGAALHAPGAFAHYSNGLHAVHAESEPLQFLSETGLMGLGFALWWLWSLVHCRGPAWSGIAAIAVASCFSFPFHSAPHALAALLLCGTLRCSRLSPASAIQLHRTKSPAFFACLAAVVPIALLSATHWLPSFLTAHADRASVSGEAALPLYERALKCTPDLFETGELRLHYTIALFQASEHENGVFHAKKVAAALEAAAQRIDTCQIHLLRGRHLQFIGHMDEARDAFRAALYRWPEDPIAQQAIKAIESEKRDARDL